MALDYHYDNFAKQTTVGEFYLLEKTKIMLYLPREVTPSYSSVVSRV